MEEPIIVGEHRFTVVPNTLDPFGDFGSFEDKVAGVIVEERRGNYSAWLRGERYARIRLQGYRWTSLVEVSVHLSLATFKAEQPSINWSAVGSQDVETATLFASALAFGVELATRFQNGFSFLEPRDLTLLEEQTENAYRKFDEAAGA